jgi:hypothetical protein
MADSAMNSVSFSRILSEISRNNNESDCKQCREYELQLKEALEELGLARKIIEILQKEISRELTTSNADGNDPFSPITSSKPANSMEWTLVLTRNYSCNPKKSVKHKVMNSDQTTIITNQFSLLHNLEIDNSEGTIPVIINGASTMKGRLKEVSGRMENQHL